VIEADIWARLRLSTALADIHASRIENAVTSGVFDTELSWDNQTVWIELKRSPDDELRISQRAWSRKRMAKGCDKDMYILYALKTGFAIVPVHFILEREDSTVGSSHARAFPNMGELVAFIKGHWRDSWTQ
jgi:hypothetical protein